MIRLPSLLPALVLGAALAATHAPTAAARQPSEAPAAAPAGTPQRLAAFPLTIRTADGRAHVYHVELARTPAEQAIGMMFRRSVAQGGGMLFPFTPPRRASFWMKNTLVPLDLVFIAPGGRVDRVARGLPLTLTPIESSGPVAAVLELAAGEAERIGLQPGDLVVYDVPE